MPQLLALEWDQFEARIVVAQQRGDDVRVDHAFSVSLAPRDPGETFADTNVGQRIESALAARRIGKAEALVAVGRSNIELRRLTLPPAPVEEWPDLVRFQALPQFSNLGDDWPLDFFPLEEKSAEGSSVLAATISPQTVKQIASTCEAAGLTPTHLVLRPCAAASLLMQRSAPLTQSVRLFIDLLADEADLTVLVDRHVVLMRTVRLPAISEAGDGDPHHDQALALGGEIRRTIASAQNQLGGQRVEQIVLCGDREGHRELSKQLAERSGLPVEHFDPFESLRLSKELKDKPPQQPERFAPLLGLVLDEAASRRHAIDFLNPRKKPPVQDRKRLYALAGGAAAAIVLAVLVMFWLELSGMESRNATLQQTSDQLDEQVESAEEMIARVEDLEDWDRNNTQWLNGLERLSSDARFPPAEDVRIAELKTARLSRGGGQISLSGFARESDVILQIESMVRDQRHTVVSGPSRETDKDPRYPWQFQETVRIDPLADEESGGGR